MLSTALRSPRWLGLASLLALAAAPGCSSGADAPEGDVEASTDPITVIDQTIVKRQSIGNCWAYATASWAESLAKSAGQDLNISESYISYFHWFDQIANGGVSSSKPEVSTGGWWHVAVQLMTRYGVMLEGDFIADEANVEMSGRQKRALDAMNVALKSGALSTPEARRNRTLVRAELDKAWGLSPAVVAQLDRIFGKGVTRTLDRSPSANLGTKVMKTSDIAVMTPDPATHQQRRATLRDVIGSRPSFGGGSGPLAWRSASYPFDARGRRDFQKRVQRAMADHAPVVISWFVDFNALDAEGRFAAPPATPGRQGGHMTVLDDYEIQNVPGFGTLKAGVDATPEQLTAALDDRAEIVFFRVKNSWGSFRPDRQFVVPGYHDLYMPYLNGPVDRCEEDANGNTDPENCFPTTPLNQVILPAGY
jgi:hypothetical protein